MEGQDHGGYKTLREIILAKQAWVPDGWSEEQMQILWEAAGTVFNLSFAIRSALLAQCLHGGGLCPEIHGVLYENELTPDRLPPRSGKDFPFVLWKDVRTKFFGKPVDPKTHGSWVLSSEMEYKNLKK
jgi:hypothetical protein